MAWPYRFYRCCISPVRYSGIILQRIHYSDTVATKLETDFLDEFTTQLVRSKSQKWSQPKWKSNRSAVSELTLKKTNSGAKNLEVKLLSIQQINMLFERYISNDNNEAVITLMKECITHRKCPKLSVINFILNYCASVGDRDLILEIKKLCEELDPSLKDFSEKGLFNLHLAEAIWVKGDINKSLDLFKEVYRENICLRRKIRLSLKNLITSMVSSRSEASLLNIIAFCESLEEEFNDLYPLVLIWQYCFLSEWFSDQTLALELLESNKKLFNAVSDRLQFVVCVSLRNDNIEVVYRLLEYILRNDLKSHCSGILMALFDNHLNQRNLQGCSTIVRWCQENGVTFPNISNEKLLELLIKFETGIVIGQKKTKHIPKTYDFKF